MATINRIYNTFPLTDSLPMYQVGPIFLSTGDISTLSTVGKLLIPAPGNGFANIPYEAWAEASTGTGWAGSSIANFVNGSNTNITASTLFLGLGAGSNVINSAVISVTGATVATYSNLNNQGTYLLAPSIGGGGTQTCQVWVRYFIFPLV